MSLYPLLRPLLFALSPEAAHGVALATVKSGLVRAPRGDFPTLKTHLWGLDFLAPLGLAAGFDKDGAAVTGLLGLGFGFVEIGSVTPRPQAGNAKPRLFRLAEDQAVINRMGFNSAGRAAVAKNLTALAHPTGPLGVNLGKNKDSSDAAEDYRLGAEALAGFASYLVVNVSSPNTPGLRNLQAVEELKRIVDAVRSVEAAQEKPLLVKIAPDLTDEDLAALCAFALEAKLDGLIVSNTTISRPADLKSSQKGETGGLSGKPLFALSTEVLGQVYRLTQGKIPLIGVGGVSSAADAYAKIRAGASLVQLYTALVYQGPGLVDQIVRGLVPLLEGDGFSHITQAIGADHR